MSKPKSLTERLSDLEAAAERASEYEKLFDKACQLRFHMSASSVEKTLKNGGRHISAFEKSLCEFFGLQTEKDRADFLRIMCLESSRNFFEKERTNPAAKEQG